MGCNGGWITKSFEFLIHNGAQSRSSYPYLDRLDVCNMNPSAVVARVAEVYGIADAKIVIKDGPIGVYVHALGDFASYGGGIFDGHCANQYDHALSAVGFGNEGGVEYWIIRNSWGPEWGEGGYIRVKDRGNCHLTFDSTPRVE